MLLIRTLLKHELDPEVLNWTLEEAWIIFLNYFYIFFPEGVNVYCKTFRNYQ